MTTTENLARELFEILTGAYPTGVPWEYLNETSKHDWLTLAAHVEAREAKLTQERSNAIDEANHMRNCLQAKTETETELREALEKYARHTHFCESHFMGVCTCGFDTAKELLK